jgi:para-nitrobenzyl esterase
VHLASPRSRGLFDRAIVQSGAYGLDEPALADAETTGLAVTHGLGCETQTAECLRGIPVADLLAAAPDVPGQIGATVDGYVLPQTSRAAFETGSFNRVPVMEGSTHDEFTIFTALSVEFMFGPVSEAFYPVVVNILVPTIGLDKPASAVLGEYPVTSYDSPGSAISAIGTDAVFACPGRQASQLLSKFVRTYAYEFNDPNAPQLFVPPATFPYKAYHASEIQYLFDVPDQQNAPELNAEQLRLADTMVRYWTRFASTGSPNGWGAPKWPRYTAESDTHQSLQPPGPVQTTGFGADHHCAFWDAP